MLFAIRLVQLAQLKPIFLSDCSPMARDNRSRLMARPSKHDTSVTRPWVILHLTMQPARLRVSNLSCQCHLDTWIPRALHPVKIPSMHPLIFQSIGGREVTWLSDPQGSPWFQVRMKSPSLWLNASELKIVLGCDIDCGTPCRCVLTRRTVWHITHVSISFQSEAIERNVYWPYDDSIWPELTYQSITNAKLHRGCHP